MPTADQPPNQIESAVQLRGDGDDADRPRLGLDDRQNLVADKRAVGLSVLRRLGTRKPEALDAAARR